MSIHLSRHNVHDLTGCSYSVSPVQDEEDEQKRPSVKIGWVPTSENGE